jgi:hypothetical protein
MDVGWVGSITGATVGGGLRLIFCMHKFIYSTKYLNNKIFPCIGIIKEIIFFWLVRRDAIYRVSYFAYINLYIPQNI